MTFAIICSAVVFAGCASTRQFVTLPDQKRAVEDPAKCRIYVFRPEAMLGGIAKMKVKDGERMIGDLGMKSFLCWERDPGKVTVFLDFYSSNDYVVNMREDLDAQGGAVYYLRAGLMTMNPLSNDPNRLDRLWRLKDDEGKELLRKCKAPPVTLSK
jgi:hypothetical protein